MVATPLPMLPYVDEAERERHERRLERDRRRREQGKQTYFESDATVDSAEQSAMILQPSRRRRPARGVSRRRRSTRRGSRRRGRESRRRARAGDPGLAARPRALGRDLRLRDRPLARDRARSRDRAGGGVRHQRPGQRVRDRVPAPEHGAVARRRLGSLCRLRSCLQRPAREGRTQARVAGRLVGVLADASRPRRGDGAVRRHRSVGDGDLPLRAWRAGTAPWPPRSRDCCSRSCSCSD